MNEITFFVKNTKKIKHDLSTFMIKLFIGQTKNAG